MADTDWTPGLVLKHFTEILNSYDVRYQERFAAQEKAVKDALAAQEKAVNAALAASEKAVSVAETNAAQWRAGANEWRSAMTDRERNFATQAEFLLMKERIDKNEGSGKGMRELWGWLTAAVVMVVSVVSNFFVHK